MRVTRWGEYGILCCLYLARRSLASSSLASGNVEEPIGATEIAEQQRIPTQYAQQILHRLRKGNIIKSVRGPKGGFLLVKSPTETNLREILYAAEGKTFELICDADPVFEEECGADHACQLRGVWQDLRHAVDSLLESRTLSFLLTSEDTIRGCHGDATQPTKLGSANNKLGSANNKPGSANNGQGQNSGQRNSPCSSALSTSSANTNLVSPPHRREV